METAVSYFSLSYLSCYFNILIKFAFLAFRNNGVYSSYDLNFVFNKFTQAKKMWDESKDCDELKHTIETLVDAGKLQNVKKIVCFGLGQFFHDIKGELRDHRLTSQSWRCLGQHAAALTIAGALNIKQGGEKVALFAQDPAYFEHDKAVLRHFGFKIMDGSHGVQEGFVEVDERTFVMCVNFGDRVQQVVCETSRPAAMIVSSFQSYQPLLQRVCEYTSLPTGIPVPRT